MDNTKAQGTRSMGAVMSKMVKMGTILLPIGDNERYDFVVDTGEKFVKVQCKTGRLKGDVIAVEPSSMNLEKGHWVRKGYAGQVDLFGIYAPALDKVYVVPAEGLTNRINLRLKPAKNNQQKRIRWAADFEVR